jgi:L-fuconolactonase
MRPVGEGEFVQGLVDKVSYSYNVLYNVFKRLSKGDAAAERAAMFHDTAARVYRIAV